MDERACLPAFPSLAEAIVTNLREFAMLERTVAIKVRYADFTNVTRGHTAAARAGDLSLFDS
jgi:impB/mucB/samB family C-terminal domain